MSNLDLLDACRAGDLGKVQLLLAAGADKNAKYKDGCTALLLASANGHVSVVKALLDHIKKLATNIITNDHYVADDLDTLQRLRKQGGRAKEAVTSVIKDLAGTLPLDQVQSVIRTCDDLIKRHRSQESLLAELSSSSNVLGGQKGKAAEGSINVGNSMLVAYLSITDNKSKVGNSATLSLFKKLCISREVTGAQKPPASSFDAASVQSAGVGPQSALTRLNAPGKGDRFNPHNEL